MFGARLNKLGAALKSRPPQAAFNFSLAGQDFDERITYTGASARMYFDSTGTLRYAPMNLLTASADFNDAAWNIKTNVTLTSGISDPFGGTSAWTMTRTSGASSAVLGDSFTGTSGATYTGAWYVRRRSGAGTVDLVVGDNVNQTISPTSSWQRLSASNTATSTTIRQYISLTGAGTDEIDIAFSSINLGTEVFDYIPTTTAAVYLPRSNAYQDHNPDTLAPLGFLIEEQRTNSIRNNTMQGAVAGTPGTAPTNWSVTAVSGLTLALAGVGTEGGISYVDVSFTGTGTGAQIISFDTTTGITAATAQTWSESAFLKLAAGTLANVDHIKIRMIERTAAGANVTSQTGAALSVTTASLASQRFTHSAALTGGATVERLQPTIEYQTSGAVSFTLRIGLPQLELGAFATSPILTTGAAATRLADVASITGTNFSSFWNQTEGTVVARALRGADSVMSIVSASLTNNNENRFEVHATAAAEYRATVRTLNVEVAAINVVSSANQTTTALAYKADDIAFCVNGGTVGTDTSAALPTVAQLNLGVKPNGSDALNGHLQSLTYYAKRLPNATLQSLTV
jgi:hypothetical protein